MGNELTGILSGTGAKMKGEVMADHVRFRGALQADVPFEEIVAEVRGTLLVLSFDGHVVELGAGAKANALAAQLRNRPSRLDRLGVEYGMTAALAGPVDPTLKAELGNRATVAQGAPKSPVDLLCFALENTAQIDSIARLAPLVAATGALWIFYPTADKSALEAKTIAASKTAGFQNAASIRFSPTHTAAKFIRRK